MDASNRVQVGVIDYAPDPRGTGFFQGLSAVYQRGIDGRTGLITRGDKGSAEQSFNGYAARRQAFSGEAALATYGAAQPLVAGPPMFVDAQPAFDVFGKDLTLRIYAARARRRR